MGSGGAHQRGAAPERPRIRVPGCLQPRPQSFDLASRLLPRPGGLGVGMRLRRALSVSRISPSPALPPLRMHSGAPPYPALTHTHTHARCLSARLASRRRCCGPVAIKAGARHPQGGAAAARKAGRRPGVRRCRARDVAAPLRRHRLGAFDSESAWRAERAERYFVAAGRRVGAHVSPPERMPVSPPARAAGGRRRRRPAGCLRRLA